MGSESEKLAATQFEQLAKRIETEKPYGCHVLRKPSGELIFSFGIPREDLPRTPILPLVSILGDEER